MKKYIKNAVYWNGIVKAWLRISDLNLVEKENNTYYTPAHQASRAIFVIHDAFPYKKWMDEYIGTDKNLKADERLNKKCCLARFLKYIR